MFSGTLATQSLRLPGQYFDPETGNNHNGFRDYSGTLTRYVQSDPIGLGGGMNTFQYVKGNPFKYTDRLGLDPGSPACKEGSVMCGSGPGHGPIWHFLNPDDPDPAPSGPGGGPRGGDPTPCTIGSVLCNSGPGGGPPDPFCSFTGSCGPGGPGGGPGPLGGGGGPGGGGGGGNAAICTTDDPICGNNFGGPILTSIWQGAAVGGADGFADGFAGGELFGPEGGLSWEQLAE